MGLMGCSSEAEVEVEPEVVTPAKFSPEVASYVTWFEEAQRAAEGRAESSETRTWAAPTGYVQYEDGIQPVGIAFTQNNQAPKIGNLFYSNGKWKTNINEISAGNYYLYGYIPHETAIRFSVTDGDGTNASYSTGAIMTLGNVPTVMPNDLCVVIGAKHGFDKDHDGSYADMNSNGTYDEGTDVRTNRLRRGDFEISAAAVAIDKDPSNFIFLLFDHLYASLRINLKVYADYDELRTIKLKKLMLSTKAGETTSMDHNNITITLAKTENASTDPIQSIDYAQTGHEIGSVEGDDKGIVFWKSAAGKTLDTSFQTYTSHFMPVDITTLVLTSVYDVYDKKGNKVREDCEATNELELSKLFTGQEVTQRGMRYTINMTINPTYLYVLSEPDLDSPTVEIN